jgi:pimeloyl-ACP methyl ester carboxylesterase
MKKNPIKRGVRYWVLLVLLIGILSIPFMNTVYALLAKFTLPGILWAAVLFYLLLAVLEVYRNNNPVRMPVFESDMEEFGLKYEDVTFQSRDGWELSGWYVPSANGADVILSHGFSANRLSMIPFARLLSQHGYGVLLYDLRAHGRSKGNLCTWGWLESNDLLGAVDYLIKRHGTGARIGAFGLSMGGCVSLRAAAQSRQLKAVVADGPALSGSNDFPFHAGTSVRIWWGILWLWIVSSLQEFLTGASQPEGLPKEIPKIAPRPILLISTGKRGEQRVVRRYYELANEPKTLLEIPEARHAAGLFFRAEEYEGKLLEFFDQNLT